MSDSACSGWRGSRWPAPSTWRARSTTSRITLTPDARAADVIDALDPLLAPYGGVGAYDRPLQVSHRFLDEELKQLQVMTRMFTVIFLAVSGFLLNVVLSRLISSERNQIGMLKAFGYSRWEVGLHYGQLALLMVSAGILPGLALGAWMGHSIANRTWSSIGFHSWTGRCSRRWLHWRCFLHCSRQSAAPSADSVVRSSSRPPKRCDPSRPPFSGLP